MANPYYAHTGYPPNSAEGQAVDQRAEFLALQAGFDKLPALAGNANKIVVVNTASDGLTVMGGANVTETAWAPTLTASTPGNLAVTYTTRAGMIARTGNIFILTFEIATSAFTHTTASGNVLISDIPSGFDASAACVSTLIFTGITKASYTQFGLVLQATGSAGIMASGSAVAESAVTIAQVPTGGTPSFRGCIAMLAI